MNRSKQRRSPKQKPTNKITHLSPSPQRVIQSDLDVSRQVRKKNLYPATRLSPDDRDSTSTETIELATYYDTIRDQLSGDDTRHQIKKQGRLKEQREEQRLARLGKQIAKTVTEKFFQGGDRFVQDNQVIDQSGYQEEFHQYRATCQNCIKPKKKNKVQGRVQDDDSQDNFYSDQPHIHHNGVYTPNQSRYADRESADDNRSMKRDPRHYQHITYSSPQPQQNKRALPFNGVQQRESEQFRRGSHDEIVMGGDSSGFLSPFEQTKRSGFHSTRDIPPISSDENRFDGDDSLMRTASTHHNGPSEVHHHHHYYYGNNNQQQQEEDDDSEQIENTDSPEEDEEEDQGNNPVEGNSYHAAPKGDKSKWSRQELERLLELTEKELYEQKEHNRKLVIEKGAASAEFEKALAGRQSMHERMVTIQKLHEMTIKSLDDFLLIVQRHLNLNGKFYDMVQEKTKQVKKQGEEKGFMDNFNCVANDTVLDEHEVMVETNNTSGAWSQMNENLEFLRKDQYGILKSIENRSWMRINQKEIDDLVEEIRKDRELREDTIRLNIDNEIKDEKIKRLENYSMEMEAQLETLCKDGKIANKNNIMKILMLQREAKKFGMRESELNQRIKHLESEVHSNATDSEIREPTEKENHSFKINEYQASIAELNLNVWDLQKKVDELQEKLKLEHEMKKDAIRDMEKWKTILLEAQDKLRNLPDQFRDIMGPMLNLANISADKIFEEEGGVSLTDSEKELVIVASTKEVPLESFHESQDYEIAEEHNYDRDSLMHTPDAQRRIEMSGVADKKAEAEEWEELGRGSKLAEVIRQLSMIILSKDSSIGMDDDTKRLIKEIFPKGMAKNVAQYENRIRELEEDNQKLVGEIKNEMIKTEFYIKAVIELSEVFIELCNLFEYNKNVELPVSFERFKNQIVSRQENVEDVYQDCLRVLPEYESINSKISRESMNADSNRYNLRESYNLPSNPPLFGYTNGGSPYKGGRLSQKPAESDGSEKLIHDMKDEIEALRSKLETTTAENSSLSLQLLNSKQREETLARQLEDQKTKVADVLKRSGTARKGDMNTPTQSKKNLFGQNMSVSNIFDHSYDMISQQPSPRDRRAGTANTVNEQAKISEIVNEKLMGQQDYLMMMHMQSASIEDRLHFIGEQKKMMEENLLFDVIGSSVNQKRISTTSVMNDPKIKEMAGSYVQSEEGGDTGRSMQKTPAVNNGMTPQEYLSQHFSKQQQGANGNENSAKQPRRNVTPQEYLAQHLNQQQRNQDVSEDDENDEYAEERDDVMDYRQEQNPPKEINLMKNSNNNQGSFNVNHLGKLMSFSGDDEDLLNQNMDFARLSMGGEEGQQ